MRLRSIVTVLSAIGVSWSGSIAGARAADGIEIEFNKAEIVDSGCRLTFKSTNNLGVKLESFTIEVYLLDPKGVALQSVQFTFGAIAAAKARFAKFDLKNRPCGEIGGIFVNEFKSCKSDTDLAEKCRDTLSLKNLTAIPFSDGAQ